MRGAAARHGRGHERQPRSGRGAVRRLDRPARRRGHEADRDHLPEPRREPGRELPQDDGRDGHGPPGHPDQARRPPPQHAHARRALPKQKQIEKARETLEIYAPLAHRLGIHAIKWELEDLSFQRLHPRKYDEIKKLVSQQRAERERYVDGRRRVPAPRAEEGRHRGRDLRPRQALLLDLLEDDQEGARVQRDLRPHRDAGDRRLGQGLLRRDRDHPLDLEAAAGPVQGLRSRPRS